MGGGPSALSSASCDPCEQLAGRFCPKSAQNVKNCAPNVRHSASATNSFSDLTAARPTIELANRRPIVSPCSVELSGCSSVEKEMDATQKRAENMWNPESKSMPSRISKQNAKVVEK